MPASFKLILAPTPDREGLHDVRLRIIQQRVVRYFNVSGVAVTPKQWNLKATTDKEDWIKTNHYEHADLNSQLFDLLRRAKKLGREQPALGADELKRLLSTGADLAPALVVKSADFLAFAYQSYQQDDVGSFAQATCEVRRSNLNKLAAWWNWGEGQHPLPCDQLTEELLADFEAYLKKTLKNGPGTRRKNLQIISLYADRAIRKKLLPKGGNPVDDYPLPKADPHPVWLSDAEFAALESVALPPQQHLARTTYLIQYYLHGSRIGVVLRLQWKQRRHGAVRFTMDKGATEKLVEESPQLTALLDSLLPEDGSAPDPEAFILPWLPAGYWRQPEAKALKEIKNATATVNMNLKRAAEKAGIGVRVSTHTSRRAVASQADDLTGDLGIAQSLLGHSTRAMTEAYTKGRDSKAVRAGARQLYAQRPMPPVRAAKDQE